MERGNLDQVLAVGAPFPGHLVALVRMVLPLVRADTCTAGRMTKNTTCSKGSKRILP